MEMGFCTCQRIIRMIISGTRRPHVCGYCGKELSNKWNWQVHVRDKHEQTDQLLFCPLCEKTAKNQESLRKHISYYHSTSTNANKNSLP